jgi:hypothetical protein
LPLSGADSSISNIASQQLGLGGRRENFVRQFPAVLDRNGFDPASGADVALVVARSAHAAVKTPFAQSTHHQHLPVASVNHAATLGPKMSALRVL